jgi:DNA-binding NarL/FixJ family response regulator
MMSLQPPLRPLNLLIVDDQPLVARALHALLRGECPGWNIDVATDWEQAARIAAHSVPRLALIDPGMPEEVRFRSLRAFAAAYPAIRLMILDDTFQPAVLRIAIGLRAAGYWTKQHSTEQIAAALVIAAEDTWTACPEADSYAVLRRGRIHFHRPTNVPVLTRREVDVLGLLARGLSVRACAERLHLSPNTVDNHKSRLMKKLGLHRLSELILWAAREGLAAREEKP